MIIQEQIFKIKKKNFNFFYFTFHFWVFFFLVLFSFDNVVGDWPGNFWEILHVSSNFQIEL